jgi:hypothetical protein
VLDDVQFLRRGWHNRDRVKTANGVQWLTVPVLKKGRYDQLIKDVRINNDLSWRREHLRCIKINYGKAPNFERFFSKISQIYAKDHSFLIDLNMDLLNFIAGELGVKTPMTNASYYKVKSTSSQRLVDLVKAVEGTVYLTGKGSSDYLDVDLFSKENIDVKLQGYEVPVYDQLYGDFVAGLSSLDYLMVTDLDRIRKEFKNDRAKIFGMGF